MLKRITISTMLLSVVLLSDVSGQVVAQVRTPDIPSEAIVGAGECKFKVKSMFGGEILNPQDDQMDSRQAVYYLPYPGTHTTHVIRTFALFCIEASEDQIGTQLDAKQVDGKWFVYNPSPYRNTPELTPFNPGAHPRTVSFKGSNWTGVGFTVDDTTGDETTRARTFRFCLIHQTHALCGDTPVQWLADPKKRNELRKIKAILESVEFVDALPPTGSKPQNDPAEPSVQ